MPRAIINLELEGEQVNMETAEELANMINTALMLAPKSGDTKIKIGQITLKGDDE